MILFFDTSALAKFFHNEVGTEAITDLLNSQENEPWILELARLEFISALHRRFRSKEIDEKSLVDAIDGFEAEITRFNIEPLSHAIVPEAEDLLKKHGKEHGLRTLDALHLGCFSLVSESDWLFVSADENLCKVAEHTGARVFNLLKKQPK